MIRFAVKMRLLAPKLLMGFVIAYSALLIIIAALGMGDAQSILNFIFTLIVSAGLAVSLCFAVIKGNAAATVTLSLLYFGLIVISGLMNPIDAPFWEGLIAYDIFRLITALVMACILMIAVLKLIMPKMIPGLVRAKIFYILMCFAALEAVTAIVLIILAIVYAAKGGDTSRYVFKAIMILVSAGLIPLLYMVIFADDFADLDKPIAAKNNAEPIKEAAAAEAPIADEAPVAEETQPEPESMPLPEPEPEPEPEQQPEQQPEPEPEAPIGLDKEEDPK